MKVKYKEGDIFVIPMSNGKYALCQIVFAPKQKFKQAIGFCILSIQNTKKVRDSGALTPLSFEKFGKEGNDSNLLIVFYVQIMPDDFVMQLHRF
ncbi:hypothetical protein PHDIMM138B_28285 [Phytobacter diazotrophicus]